PPGDNSKNAPPVRWIKGVSRAALPELSYAWMWAHAQVTAESDLEDQDVKDRLSAEGDSHVVSRLICPRRLATGTKYTAFVVPTFKIGHVAAGVLGGLGSTDDALTPAWIADHNATDKIDLAYYYKWEFATAAARGDFEYLLRL